MSRTFLVVDDDPDLRTLLAAALARFGHHTVGAATVAEARRLCAEERPEVLLLDVTMPDVDGPDFLATLRAEGLTPPHVYLVSALEPDDLADLAASLGVGHLQKPFTLSSLREGLADVV